MNKLYVGNLSYNVTDQDLHTLFSNYGELLGSRLIIDRNTGRSKGFAFIEFKTELAAKQALETLNGQDLQGRPLRISIAKDKTEHAPRNMENI